MIGVVMCMKRQKTLKRITIFQILYCTCCVLSCILFLIHDHTENYRLHELGMLFMFGWIINPIGPITLIVGLLDHIPTHEAKEVSPKWIWFILWPVIDTILWIVSGGIMVKVTGGV